MEQKNEKNFGEYNIGLDIGTNSVGWAVTDLKNNILKRGKKNMWGARLFDEGITATQTRNFRGTRRRIERRKERINILQSLMLDDMEKKYPNFFHLLNETSKIENEKNQDKLNGKKYNLFSELNFSDQNYYKLYPTIYHLRKELMENKERQDLRLVYLAIHHIIKYRGNFLYEGELKNSTDEISESIEIILNYMLEEFNIDFNSNTENFKDILKDKTLTKSNKKYRIMKLFDFGKDEKTIVNGIACAILGYKFDVNKIFNIDIENSSISFSSDILNEEEIRNELQKNDEVYDALKKIYNWFILEDILQGSSSISDAYIKKYNEYKTDLSKLKKVYKDNLKNKYNEMFREEEKASYALYDKNISKCPIEDLYKKIKQDLEEAPECKEKLDIINDIENENFLIKINTTANAAIPYQLHYQELETILNNQAQFYQTLKENKENILELMKFRIPYYVGPLAKNNNSKFAWVVRKNEENVRPWNFEQVVDIDATAEKFIRRMTNKCTYLLNEDVIPKQSILYSEFCVRNELANIRVNGYKLSPQTKDLVINKLFKVKKSIKLKDFKQFLLDYQLYKSVENISGLAEEDKFMSNMISSIDMQEIFGSVNENNIQMIEKIIEWITIFEDKKILKRKIKKEYGLDSKIIDKIARKKYIGWSRLSKELLINLKAYDDGKNIMEKLQSTELNFMQIINNKQYGFDKQIEERIKPKDTIKITYDMIDEIPTSPANKRAIWQTVKVVNEITKIMKREPKNIYIEFAREEQNKKTRKDSRAKALLKIYNSFAEEIQMLNEYNPKVYKELKNKQNDKEFNERLYLYFTQMGKCLYSSKPLNIDELSKYEVDHILPQSYIKDDSLSNKALVYKDEYLYTEYVKDYIKKSEENNSGKNKNGIVMGMVINNIDIRKIKETLNYKDCFITRKLEEQTGEFYNQTLYSPKDKKVNPVIALKENRDVSKYGGYSGENKAYFTIFSYIDSKNEEQIEMIGIPIKISYDIKNGKITIEEYIKSKIANNASRVKVIKTKVLKYQEYLDENNETMVLLSDSEIRTNKQLVISPEINNLIYAMNKEKLNEDEELSLSNEMNKVYNYLLNKMKKEYIGYKSSYEKLNSSTVREKFQNANFKEKVLAINGIIDIMHRGQGNMKSLGEYNALGRKNGQKFKTEKIKNMTFIDKSVTGMYERRYKINGMENDCNS